MTSSGSFVQGSPDAIDATAAPVKDPTLLAGNSSHASLSTTSSTNVSQELRESATDSSLPGKGGIQSTSRSALCWLFTSVQWQLSGPLYCVTQH